MNHEKIIEKLTIAFKEVEPKIMEKIPKSKNIDIHSFSGIFVTIAIAEATKLLSAFYEFSTDPEPSGDIIKAGYKRIIDEIDIDKLWRVFNTQSLS